ncbi:MAG: hypothetical protein H6587_12255 [Flavobacteriales bacterium]|nr:hypothetical protein [Flavobacteriales bacterium]
MLNEINGNGILLYDYSEYNLQRKIEVAFFKFIRKNIWLFLPQIITKLKNEKLSSNSYPSDFIIIIEKHDLSYEYPRSFYRTRGRGTTLVDSEYDIKIKEKHEKYILCSSQLDKSFESLVFQNITCSIAGKIITEYADTSIGVVLGLKYKWTEE